MALVAIEQGDLDTIATTIVQVADQLQGVLDSPTQLAPADQRGVEDALTKLRSVHPRVPTDAPPVSEPVDPDAPEPAPVPEAPVVTDPAAGDAVVTDPAAGDAVVSDPAATSPANSADAETSVPVPNPDTAPVDQAPVSEVDDVAPVDAGSTEPGPVDGTTSV